MFLADLLFPKFCLGCGFLGCYICSRCQKKLSYLNFDRCLYCDKKSLFGFTHVACFRKNGVDGTISIFAYNDFLKKIIKSIKYDRVKELWDELSLIIPPDQLLKLGLYKKLNDRFFIQPIPLHPKKITARGFNQAKIMTEYFQKYLSFTIGDYLLRIKETKPQSYLKKDKDRLINLRGAFATKANVAGKNIILVDDLQTSGATIKEAARTLKKRGANKVFALTLAKG